MSLAPGARVGPHEISARLGEGGMGEVYRATDSRLRREVAIKVLPAAFTADRERLARFEREAQTLAALNHPNIAAIYGLEESNGTRALVMELVEGEDLSARIARGSLPVEEALTIARQIAEALEAAHEQGIVHRDLKPANVKVRPDGTVKVLDFGLAKAMEPATAGDARADLARSPTLTAAHGTQLGVILGTAAYMSPEQARGGAIDKRADVWAFGVVLYEMLTGRRLFEGETVSDTLAAVLRAEIDWALLPAATPAALRTLLRRCLERNPRSRLHAVADARIVIEELQSGRASGEAAAPPLDRAAAGRVPAWRRALPWGVSVAALVVAAFAVATRSTPASGVVRSHVAPPKEAYYFFQGDFGSPVQLSPDGTAIVFGTRKRGESLTARLGWRSLATGETREIAGTEGAFAPFFSPDGRSIGFFADGELRTVPLAGGAPFKVAPAPIGRGGAWAPDGTIVYSGNFRDRLWKVPAVGGTPQPLTTVDATKHSSHRWPVITPDGGSVVYLALNHSPEQNTELGLRIVGLDGGGDRPLVATPASGAFAAGRLLFTRGTTLFAQPFEAGSGALSGAPVAVAQDVRVDSTTWRAVFAAGEQRLVHAVGEAGETMVSAFAGNDPRQRQDVTARGGYRDVAVSPDGKRLAVTRGATANSTESDLWILDLERGTETRFTLEPESEWAPTWSPDGRWIYYGSRGHSDLKDRVFRRPADRVAPPELVLESSAEVDVWPRNFTPDGRSLLLVTGVTPFAPVADVQLLALDGSKRLTPVLDGVAAEADAFLSPDGKLVTYTSLESGRLQNYVAEIGPDGRAAARWQISVDGGRRPVWTRDGRAILFLDERANLIRVDVERTAGTVRFGKPVGLVSTTAVQDADSLAVGPDGRIWMVQFGEEQGEPLRLIENWTELLPR